MRSLATIWILIGTALLLLGIDDSQDVDRNMIENQVDTFATAEEAHKCWSLISVLVLSTYHELPDMQQDADFLINPIGVDFVPEEIMARLAAGESQESVMKRHSMGPRVPSSVPFPL